MVITWYGKNCFKLQSGELVVVTDPFVPLRGISGSEKKETKIQPFRGRADIIIKTLVQTSSIARQEAPDKSDAFEISYPGEYEIKNVTVKGWSCLPAGGLADESTQKANDKEQAANLRSVYLVEMDDFKIVLLGHLTDENEIKNALEYLEDADIVFIPAGGKPFIEALAAAKLIRQLKPGLIIPTLFDDSRDLKSFLKEFGKNDAEPQEKLTITKKELSKEKLIIGCLKT